MERVQRTVEIKLTPEECEILWKAEQLLREMEKEISGITTPVYQSDKEEIRFPDMDVQKREFIKSGYCPDCQKALFGTEYDRSDFIIVDDIEDGEVPKM